MGMEQRVTFADAAPSWPAMAELLQRVGLPAQMRMIDRQLAFPDDVPPENWREIRVASGGHMLTLRRDVGEVRVVAWGNLDEPGQRFWQALTWAVAEAAGGRVHTPQGEVEADDFGRRIGLVSQDEGPSAS